MHQSDDLRRRSATAGPSPADRRRPSSDGAPADDAPAEDEHDGTREDRDDRDELVQAVEDLLSDLASPDEPDRP